MARDKNSPRKAPVRRYKRAGLVLPTHSILRIIREKLPGRRIQKNVDVYTTAILQHVLERLLSESADKVTSGSYITAEHLKGAMNEPDSEVLNVFPKKIGGL